MVPKDASGLGGIRHDGTLASGYNGRFVGVPFVWRAGFRRGVPLIAESIYSSSQHSLVPHTTYRLLCCLCINVWFFVSSARFALSIVWT